MNELSRILNKFSIVKQIPLFSKLNWIDISFIVNRCSLLEYNKGDIIYNEADPPNAFYCLVSGRLDAYTKNEDGQRESLEYLYRGKHFGIISLLTGENHSVTIEAINDSVVLRIEKGEFEKILKRIPHIGVDLSHSVSRRFKRRELHRKIIFESTIISVYSPIVDTDTSFYSMNLAVSLKQETNRNVIFLNINASANKVLNKLNLNEESHPLELNKINYKDTNFPAEAVSHYHQIDLLSINYDASDVSQASQISLLLSFLTNDYHYVIVNLPSRMDDVVFKIITQSDLAHFISLAKQEDLKLINRIIAKLKEELKDNFREEEFKLLIQQPDGKSSDSQKKTKLDFGDLKIYATLPEYHKEFEIPSNSKEAVSVILDPRSKYSRAIRRISREIGGVLVGLVLGGGAALGLAHIGVIKILEEENIPIDIVVGSSMGALIGALWVSGKNAKEIEGAASKFKSKLFSLRLLDFTISVSGLVKGKNINKFLKHNLGDKTFHDINRSLKVVTYDLKSRQDVVVDSGKLIDAVKESIAIPGIFKPIIRKDMMLIDGGVLNPVPTDVLVSMGIKKIIAVDTLATPEDTVEGLRQLQARLEKERNIPFWRSPIKYLKFRIKRLIRKIFFPNIFDVIVNSFQAAESVLAQESCRQADVVIHPEVAGINWFEFFNVGMLIKNGEKETKKMLPQIKELIKE